MEWEHQIKKMFDDVDDWLENKYGGLFNLHPNRSKRGITANKEMDGLFNVGADFSAGYGSQLGRGYIVRIHMSTLDHIPETVKNDIEKDTEELVRLKLSEYFPNRALKLERDRHLLKITGDFRIGSASIE